MLRSFLAIGTVMDYVRDGVDIKIENFNFLSITLSHFLAVAR